MKVVRVGTRGSELARTQTEELTRLMRAAGLDAEIVIVHTAGDRAPEARFKDLGPDIFTRALDEALMEGRIDCAVHSSKDVPTDTPPVLTIAAFAERVFPEDMLVFVGTGQETGAARSLAEMPAGSRIGTSSLRRRALLLNARPDLEMVDLRGNVRTRIRRAQELGLGAAVLARAGLSRLGIDDLVGEVLDPRVFIPQAGQGALAVSCLRESPVAAELGELLDHPATRTAVLGERAFLRRLGGGCQVPAGAYGEVVEGTLVLRGVLLSADGRTCLRATRSVAPADAESAGRDAAEEMLAAGGAEIIRRLREG